MLPKRTRSSRNTRGGYSNQQQSTSRGFSRQGKSSEDGYRSNRKRAYDDSFSRRDRKSGGRGRRNYEGEEDYETRPPKRPKKQTLQKKKGEFLSPQSFSEAWPSFFSAVAIMMVTAAGLVVDNIPKLEEIPLGGRLKYCLSNWQHICQNNWVLNVVKWGYKIPIKFKPFQRCMPSNPRVSDSAFEVLKQEALDLKSKKAVVVASPVKDQHISAYFAVPKTEFPWYIPTDLKLKVF